MLLLGLAFAFVLYLMFGRKIFMWVGYALVVLFTMAVVFIGTALTLWDVVDATIRH